MPVNDELGKRMKEYYESIPKTKLMRRTPVAIRIDGKAFHTFTRGFKKPFDEVLIKSMQETMKYLCENVQGCVLGYAQSDEITLILVDYKKLNSAAWFDYEVQKMCSIAASMATVAFNKAFGIEVDVFRYNNGENYYKDSEESATMAQVIQDVLNTQLSPAKKRAPQANANYYLLTRTPSPTVRPAPCSPWGRTTLCSCSRWGRTRLRAILKRWPSL